MRKVKGVFLENLELNDFPVDVQVNRCYFFIIIIIFVLKDLTITVSTTRTANEVLLVPDKNQLSAINTRTRHFSLIYLLIFNTIKYFVVLCSDTFIDQQEWRLHEHVETSTKLLSSPFSPSQNQHPAFSATCKELNFFLFKNNDF